MIGIDVVSIKRIERLIERFGRRALLKYLNRDEIELVKRANTAAGFWAAKEAISKALGCGIGSELSFHDIHIFKTEKNAPKVKLSERAVKIHHIKKIEISITHDADLAIAVAIATK